MKEKIYKAIFLLSVICVTVCLNAQTVIREEVRIKPVNKQSQVNYKQTSGFFPCGPWPHSIDSITAGQVVWAGETLAIDPGQQPLWGQENNFLPFTRSEWIYEVEVVAGGSLIEFYKFKQNFDSDGNSLEDSMTVVPPHLINIYGVEIRGDGDEWVQGCYNVYNLSFHKYLVKFKENVSGTVKIKYTHDYDSFYVVSYVVQQSYHLDYQNQIDSTYHNYEYKFAPGFVMDNCPDCSFSITNEICNYQIVEGEEFGILYHEETREAGSSLYSIPSKIIFIANGINPKVEGLVKIRVTPQANAQPVEITFRVLHHEGIVPGINVFLAKDELAAGDTVDVVIKKFYESENGYAELDFNWGTTFEVGIEEGCDIGDILTSDNRRGKYFSGLEPPIRFIVRQDVTADSVLIRLRGAADEPQGMATKVSPKNYSNYKIPMNNYSIKSEKKTNLNVVNGSSCSIASYYLNNYRIGEAVVKTYSILLGETKYYGMKNRVAGERIDFKIEEIPTKAGARPVFSKETDEWKWIESDDFWGDNPVTKISGTNLGTYWEKKDPNGKILPAGIIRLIGRYWNVETEHKVQLSDQNKRDRLDIVVKKPKKLGVYYDVKDVFGNTIILDDSICVYSGKYGIPPQLIKAHILKEAIDPFLKKIVPAYRYEPFMDKNIQLSKILKKRYFDEKYPYVVNENMGEGAPIPTSHSNAIPPYPTNPVKIGEYITENFKYYIRKKSRQVMYDAGLTEAWDKIYKILSEDKEKSKKILDNSIDSLKKYILNGKAGDIYGSIAQTRIVASYGFLNHTFYATTDGNNNTGFSEFSKTNVDLPPEYLNDMKYFFPVYNEKMYWFMEHKGIQNPKSNCWENGFENAWKKTVHWHNPKEEDYENVVFGYINNFLPSEK